MSWRLVSFPCCESNLRVPGAPLEASDGRARPTQNAFKPPFHCSQPKETPVYL